MADETYEFWDFMELLQATFPEMYQLQVPCPAHGETLYDGRGGNRGSCGFVRAVYRDTIPWTITHLNDAHHWSRDKIADWVDLISVEYGLDLTLPTPTDIPPEPGEEAAMKKGDGA